jgi:hypothetical protein
MAACHTCGNQYDKSFRIEMDGSSYEFDSFECAISALAPDCAHCSIKIIGHGVEENEQIFCCAHCASALGADQVRDRA